MLSLSSSCTSFPLWHNLSWGQVGLFTTVAILGMLALLERGHRLSAAVLVGFAASFKFFPLIFLAPFAFRRDFRFLLLAALACVAFFVVTPVGLIGPNDTLWYSSTWSSALACRTLTCGAFTCSSFPSPYS